MNDTLIRALPPDVADKIAAGEVVERPLSIVKELLENSIDAGATFITVEIGKGGKEYIRVSDNGCGIPKDELELAFMRYATSKLRTEEDLLNIGTLGFRGEALASIAAVSRTELITKTKGARTGARIRINGSQVLSIEDAACDEGTTIIVKDLFYNVPARLKFLKPDNTESALVIDFVSKMALAYPAVRIRLISNGSILFSTPGKNSLQSAILTVYSPKLARSMVQVASKTEGMEISGYTSSPTVWEKNRRKQVFFVNGRLIGSKVLEQAVAKAYSDKLFEGQYPYCFLFLNVDPRTLDVNIHPHKSEIRFYQEEEVKDFVVRALRRALLDPAALEIKHDAPAPVSEPSAEEAPSEISYKPVSAVPEVKEAPAPAKISVENVFTKPAAPSTFELNTASILSDNAPSVYEPSYANIFRQMREEEKKEEQVQEEIFDYDADRRLRFTGLTYIGQVFATYLLLKDKDGLYIMDQHAAHERVMYEKLLGRFNSQPDASQSILTPILIELDPAQMAVSAIAVDMLSSLGFDISEFGPACYSVKAIPGCMELSEAEDFAREFFDAAYDERYDLQAKKDAITMRSCKSAVKAHDKLSEAEVRKLLSYLDKCENPFSCPHGRPTFLKYSEYELEKLFKRK